MHRYNPFSGAVRFGDVSIYCRAGSTVLVFLEPKGVCVEAPSGASRQAERASSYASEAAEDAASANEAKVGVPSARMLGT